MDKLLTMISSAYTTSRQDERSLIERSVSFLLLGLICIFALNSIGNVQKYVHQYHHHWTGDALGIAFGTVVFVCAYIAATTSGQTRWVSIVIGSVFGVASAYFQTELYMSEGMKSGTAHSLSYIPILAGEVGLALLESLYSKQHKQQETAAQATELLAQLQAKTDEIAVLKTALAAAQQSHSVPPFPLPSVQALALPENRVQTSGVRLPQVSTANGHVPGLNGTTPPSEMLQRLGDLDAANDMRAALKQQRKAAIPQILAATKRALSTSELAKELQVLHGWEVSSDSVRRYCQELMEERVLESVNRKWQLCRSGTT